MSNFLRWKPLQPNVKLEKENSHKPTWVYVRYARLSTETEIFTDEYYLSRYFRRTSTKRW